MINDNVEEIKRKLLENETLKKSIIAVRDKMLVDYQDPQFCTGDFIVDIKHNEIGFIVGVFDLSLRIDKIEDKEENTNSTTNQESDNDDGFGSFDPIVFFGGPIKSTKPNEINLEFKNPVPVIGNSTVYLIVTMGKDEDIDSSNYHYESHKPRIRYVKREYLSPIKLEKFNRASNLMSDLENFCDNTCLFKDNGCSNLCCLWKYRKRN